MSEFWSAIGLAAMVTALIVMMLVAFGTCAGRAGQAVFWHRPMPICVDTAVQSTPREMQK